MNLADIRKDYRLKVLDESHVDPDPIHQFEKWMDEAMTAQAIEPTAMTLATATPEGLPSARMVLLKGVSSSGFVLYSNYKSRKGEEIEANPHVALLFYWSELERQVRIEGIITKTSVQNSDNYFQSRPFDSQLSAVISDQSRNVPNREFLEQRWIEKKEMTIDNQLVRPAWWGGWLVSPVRIEFWQGRSNRLHDRLLYTKMDNNWVISRLAP